MVPGGHSMPALLFWIVLAGSITWSTVEAQSTPFSNNPANYDFGWLAAGVYAEDTVPACGYCVNAFDASNSATDRLNGAYWNRTVGMYRCDGVQTNEFWAFENETGLIIFSNVTSEVYCIDAEFIEPTDNLTLRTCNSSKTSQRWYNNGSYLMNQQLDSSGNHLFLVAQYPNRQTNPSNQGYTYSLRLASSTPQAPQGYYETSNFTFISSKGLVTPSPTVTFTTEGLLRVSNSSLNQVINGGFENSTIQAGTDLEPSNYIQNTPSYFSLCGWVTNYGPIDYVKSGYIQPQQGAYSVHLNTFTNVAHSGSISQTIRTRVNWKYDLSFYLAAFPILGDYKRNCSSSYVTAFLQVTVTNASSSGDDTGSGGGAGVVENGELVQNFTAEVTHSSYSPGWTLHQVSFRALSNVTTVYFVSLNLNESCGPMVDEVSVSPVTKGSVAKGAIIGATVGAVVVLVLASVVAFVCYRRNCRPKEEEHYSSLYRSENARVFSYKEISAATKQFSSVLGEGAFGTVYKADFSDGSVAAVKVEKPRGPNSSSKFLASDEIAVLLRVHHRCLVNLIGFCINRGRHMLVFEYLPNGSLYGRLHQSILSVPAEAEESGVPFEEFHELEMSRIFSNLLSWQNRVKIACEVAYGLEYLHHDADRPIVHTDVKSQNVLLTKSDSAKIADFGLSKAAAAHATSFQSIETMVRGSLGYMDPQYFLTGVFSPKSDVYSYGVVLLELISGHQAIFNSASLASWAAPYMADPSLYHEMVDKKLKGKFDAEELRSLVELTKMCMQDDGKNRPSMRQVVAYLLGNRLLASMGSGSVELKEESISREKYHKLHPMFIDLDPDANELSMSSNETLKSALPNATLEPRD